MTVSSIHKDKHKVWIDITCCQRDWFLIYEKKCSLRSYKPKAFPTNLRVTTLRLHETYSPTETGI